MNFLPKTIDCEVKIEKNLFSQAKKLISNLGFANKKIIFITDDNIFNNYENLISQNIESFCSNILILENAKADEENLKKIAETLGAQDLIIAFGSGTISDLCKFSSFKNNIPYVIFASAPSMNGYLSKNASITISDHKKTMAATLPIAVFCDLNVLKKAPKSMIKAGIGDSLCFYSCWFDWLLSHLLFDSKFDPECFAILSEDITDLTFNYKNFLLTDDKLLEKLIKILLLSGAAMTISGSSNPASQSEHLISHSYSMRYPAKSENILHGIQIASTVLVSAKIQEDLLSQNQIEMRRPDFNLNELSNFFGEKAAFECQKEYKKKQNTIERNRKLLGQELTNNWQNYSQVLSRIFLSEQSIKEIFDHFNIETGPKALLIDNNEYQQVISYAKFIRNRITCLDF